MATSNKVEPVKVAARKRNLPRVKVLTLAKSVRLTCTYALLGMKAPPSPHNQQLLLETLHETIVAFAISVYYPIHQLQFTTTNTESKCVQSKQTRASLAMVSTTAVVFPRIKFLLLILWSIVLLQSIIGVQVVGQPPPLTVTSCYHANHHTGHLFPNDCESVFDLAISNPGSLSDLSMWTKTPVHESSERSDWSISHGVCHLSFRADPPISAETWPTIIEDLRAVQQDCVMLGAVGGYRIRKRYPLPHEQPGGPYLWFSVYIKQLDGRSSRALKRVRPQYSGGDPEAGPSGKPLRKSPPIARSGQFAQG
jgi:hypothetical protein